MSNFRPQSEKQWKYSISVFKQAWSWVAITYACLFLKGKHLSHICLLLYFALQNSSDPEVVFVNSIPLYHKLELSFQRQLYFIYVQFLIRIGFQNSHLCIPLPLPYFNIEWFISNCFKAWRNFPGYRVQQGGCLPWVKLTQVRSLAPLYYPLSPIKSHP